MKYARVASVSVPRPYVLELTFKDGTRQEIDVAGELYGDIFEPLKDPSFFARVALDDETGAIYWPNGADFSPEFLYSGGTVGTDAQRAS
jgi:hypothetical protein